jgi:hypothetical protein
MDWSMLSTCFASTGPRSNDSFLYRRFLVFPTISGNLLLARSKPRELYYMGFSHSKNTVCRVRVHVRPSRKCARMDRFLVMRPESVGGDHRHWSNFPGQARLA